jgi:hypothetical protein
MNSVPRNVVIDLLPAYLAGEASEETRALVEEFARRDPGIALMIHTGSLVSDDDSLKIPDAEKLEMKTLKRIRRSIRRKMWYVALATASVLMVPLIATQFTDEVKWDLFDFIVMGILLFGTGLTYVLISRVSENFAYRAAVGIAVVAGFLLVWLNLAVGIIGSEGNPANRLYALVLIVGAIGAGISRFRARGMSHTLFATALMQLLVPVMAMIFWRPSLVDPPGIAGVFILNAFFAGLFVISSLLFRRAAEKMMNVSLRRI